MTSKFTREELLNIIETDHVQCGEASELARMALAAMDSDPVAYADPMAFVNFETGNARREWMWKNPGEDLVPLYRHAQQPLVPDAIEPTIEAIKRILPTSNPDEYAACIGADMWNACRAAMLQELQKNAGAEANCRSNENVQVLHTYSPAQSGCRPAQSRVAPAQDGNSPVVPDGYVMVPKEATLDMLKAGAKQEMKGEAFQYVWQAMLAAAPQEVR
ncbi:hypothetical protein [Klebsiella pneumoniae]|uniref:hypothetical protein n=1 Tax=Klebsiella pneumoniae TaxID=573 RepID=UPI001968AB6D|nr:hypothetical protein [Klebsiella pneumoniae]